MPISSVTEPIDVSFDAEESLDAFAFQRFGNKTGSGVHEKGRETLKSILRTTIRLIVEGGFSDFSMRKVAAELGIKISAVQYYFSTREDLLRALGKFVLYWYDLKQQEVIQRDYPTPLARLEAYIDFSLDRVQQQSGYYILLGEAQTGSAIFAASFQEIYALDIKVLSDLLRPLLPEASSTQIKQRAAFISASIDGLEIYLKEQPKLAPSIPKLESFSKAALLYIATSQI
ncbi:MAG: TetR/AcrR family transcriptional regulator [Pseudomonadota bacterium]